MAQWDVYANPSPRMREVFPFVLVLQSDLLDGLETRLIAPLAVTAIARSNLPSRLCPLLEVKGEMFVLLIQESAPILSRALRRPVTNLRDQAHRVVAAINTVISGV
jgi:toxin CcdB